ncbi:MAG: DUF4391 domain-containing protein [Candidatus Cloacimonetes bacterium]|nr:DUF4391 domain-containing protein [Candidatus Cloacimonadota bacterium]
MLEFLGLPKSTVIDTKIDKKQFYDQGNLNVTERKTFVNDIEKITWAYRITYDTSNIRPFTDETRDYSEIQVIDVQLRSTECVTRICDVIMSSFQYMVILVLRHDNRLKIVMAHKRINQNDKSRLVIDEIMSSKWLSEEDPILRSFDVKDMRTTNLLDLYSDEYAALTKVNLVMKGFSGDVSSHERSKAILNEIQKIDEEIESLKSQIKKEDHFSRQIELNDKINLLRKRKNRLLDASDITSNGLSE